MLVVASSDLGAKSDSILVTVYIIYCNILAKVLLVRASTTFTFIIFSIFLNMLKHLRVYMSKAMSTMVLFFEIILPDVGTSRRPDTHRKHSLSQGCMLFPFSFQLNFP